MLILILLTIIGSTLVIVSTIKHQVRLLMTMDKTLAKQLDDATNNIAQRFQTLQDKLTQAAAGDGLTAEEAQAMSDSLTNDIAKLNAIGSDPANPIPATPPTA